MIDISDIYMIKVITEVGSINRAAEVLHMSQPTLSKKVSRLEQKISMALFNRHNAGMVPTQAAKFLLKEGEGLEVQLQVIERQLQLMANMVGGYVKVGVGPIIEQVILPKVLLDFAEREYQFKLSVVTEPADGLLEQLRTSRIDLAIGPFKAQEVSEDFSAVLETSERLVAIVRQGHALCQVSDPLVALSEVKRYPFVSPNVPKHMGGEIVALAKSVGINPNIICENYAMVKTVVANSDYVTVGPESLFRTELANGSLVKLDLPRDVSWHCNCLVKPETLLMPRVKEVVAIFAQYMTPI